MQLGSVVCFKYGSDTMGKTNRSLLEKTDAAGKCKILLCSFQRQKAKIYLFRREKQREGSFQRSHVNFSKILSALAASSSHTRWLNKPRCSQEYVPRHSHVPCHACTTRGDASLQMHRNPVGPIVTLQSNEQTVLQRQQGNWACSLFLHGESHMD